MHVPCRGQQASRASSFHHARHDGVVMMMEDGRLRRIPHFSPSVGAVIQRLRKKQSLSKHLLWWFSNKRAWTTTHPHARLHFHSFSLHSGHQFICSQPRTNFSSLAEQFFLVLYKLVEVDAEIHLAFLYCTAWISFWEKFPSYRLRDRDRFMTTAVVLICEVLLSLVAFW